MEQKIKEMKARCKNGKLVDQANKEVYFYRLMGCWGNPPLNYQELLSRQANELNRLKKHYRVVEIGCDPSGTDPRQISSTQVLKTKGGYVTSFGGSRL